MKTVYKLLTASQDDNRYYSYLKSQKGIKFNHSIEYSFDRFVVPKFGNIFAFKSIEDISKWIYIKYLYSNVVIGEAITNSIVPHDKYPKYIIDYTAENESFCDFWKDPQNIVYCPIKLSNIPYGTILCNDLKLIRIIPREELLEFIK